MTKKPEASVGYKLPRAREVEKRLKRQQLLKPSICEPIVELPVNAYEAAAILLAVIAYPALGAGGRDAKGKRSLQVGNRFATELYNRHQRQLLAQSPELFKRKDWPPPKENWGYLSRGGAQIEMRFAAYELALTIWKDGFDKVNDEINKFLENSSQFDRGEPAIIFHPEGYSLNFEPSLNKIVSNNLEYWADKFSLKSSIVSIPHPNVGSKKADKQEALAAVRRDLIKSIKEKYKQSVPIFHIIDAILRTDQGHRLISEPGTCPGNCALWLYDCLESWLPNIKQTIYYYQGHPDMMRCYLFQGGFIRIIWPKNSPLNLS